MNDLVLKFYRQALRATRITLENKPGIPNQLSHLRRKLNHNIRDGIMIYKNEKNIEKVQRLISDGEADINMIQAWKSVDPNWLERIFKKPTTKGS